MIRTWKEQAEEERGTEKTKAIPKDRSQKKRCSDTEGQRVLEKGHVVPEFQRISFVS